MIEYNCRFGDPETQVVLPRLESDLVDIMLATIDGTLDKVDIKWNDNAAVCVVMASGGYPQKYDTGFEIRGLADAEAGGAMVFHAGTKLVDGKMLTAGGRVLGVTAVGRDLDSAIAASYAAVEKITFDGAHYRRDIGVK